MPLAGPMPSTLATKMLPALVSDEDAAEDAEGEIEAKGLALDDEGADPLDDDVHAALVDVLLNEPGEKYDTSPVGSPGGQQNWVDKAGGLPAFIRAIAHALIRHGASEDRAIATAVAACKRWAAGAGKVTAKTRAKAAAAIAEWERKKASHGKSLFDVAEDTFFGWCPALDPEAGEKAAPVTLVSKGAPRLPGTFEERRDLVGAAVKSRFGGNTAIIGTAENHVVVSRLHLTDGEPGAIESFRIGYNVRGGLVHLDEPQPVALALQTADGDVTGEDIHLARRRRRRHARRQGAPATRHRGQGGPRPVRRQHRRIKLGRTGADRRAQGRWRRPRPEGDDAPLRPGRPLRARGSPPSRPRASADSPTPTISWRRCARLHGASNPTQER
jgi:hypothetical protein